MAPKRCASPETVARTLGDDFRSVPVKGSKRRDVQCIVCPDAKPVPFRVHVVGVHRNSAKHQENLRLMGHSPKSMSPTPTSRPGEKESSKKHDRIVDTERVKGKASATLIRKRDGNRHMRDLKWASSSSKPRSSRLPEPPKAKGPTMASFKLRDTGLRLQLASIPKRVIKEEKETKADVHTVPMDLLAPRTEHAMKPSPDRFASPAWNAPIPQRSFGSNDSGLIVPKTERGTPSTSSSISDDPYIKVQPPGGVAMRIPKPPNPNSSLLLRQIQESFNKLHAQVLQSCPRHDW